MVVKADALPKYEDAQQAMSVEALIPRSNPDLSLKEALIEGTVAEEMGVVGDGGEHNKDQLWQLRSLIRLIDRVRDPNTTTVGRAYVNTLTQMSVHKGLEKHGANTKQEAIRLKLFNQLFKKKKVF